MPVSSITRNKKCIQLSEKYRQQREALKRQIKQRRFKPDIKLSDHMEAVFKLDALPRNSSRVRIRSRCSITGRGRGVWRYFGICGAQIRQKAMKGMLPGVKHSSW